jgi:DNA-directed RNA polymerase II subunit RPB2
MTSPNDLAYNTLTAYYEQTPLFLTRHHIDSYEHFVFNEFPQIIFSSNPKVILKDPLPEKGLYRYKVEIYFGGNVEKPSDLRLSVGAPIITLDNATTVRRMYPNEARLRGLTYAAQISMDIDIVVTITDKVEGRYEGYTTTIPFKNYPLLKLPILLRSKLCSLGSDSTEDAMVQKGESPLEHGGYFIIDGAEKVLITRQEQAFNSLYVARKAPTDLEVSIYASVVSQHPETKNNRRCSVYMLRDERTIRVSVPSIRGPVPLFVLFRALGVESDKEIVRLIFPDPTSAFTNLYEDMLIPSIEDAWPITTQAMAINFMSTLTHQGTIASVLDILRNHLFSHVSNTPIDRAYYLAFIVRKIIKSDAKIIANTDRDDIRNQRLLTTGTLLRDLFSAIWGDWQKQVSMRIDTTFNYNESLYQGNRFLEIFSAKMIVGILKEDDLNTALIKGFRGRWGTNEFNTKVGVLQPLARISYFDAMSHCRRILLDFDTSLKQRGPRHLHPSQIGYFCTNETPTGAHIGVSKNYSILTYVSIASQYKPVINWLINRGTMVSIKYANKALRISGFTVFINGGIVGFIDENNVTKVARVLKLLKWTACLPPLCSVSFNTVEREINIYMDEGRPMRPLWHLEAGGKWPQQVLSLGSKIPDWQRLVLGSLPFTANRKISDVEFVDPFPADQVVTLDQYMEALTPYIGAIEYIDPYEANEAHISWWGANDLNSQHTHVEIHPSTMTGLMVSMIPFYNHNQSPRNQLSCSQSKQGIGYYATNYLQRYDTYGSVLCYGEAPLVRSMLFDHVGKGRVPYGYNCIVAMASTDGYNQDDGILFNKSSVERGLFRSLALRSYKGLEEVDSISKVVYRIANPKMIPSWTDLKMGQDYSKLDEQGIIREGEYIDDTTVLVGRYMENPDTHEMRDASIVSTVFTTGRVESVVILNQANGMRLVHVRILQERIPELGDKFGSRHGQKGTMGMLIPAENMPHTAEGIIPDIIVNPHGLTSRMTVAQLLECLFGRMGGEFAAKCNGTAFFNNEDIVKTVGDSLQAVGLHPHSENVMYCGTTGKQLNCSIFMGPIYFMRMKHLTSDKLNARGEGRKEIRTHQPTGGRGNEGGMRIGEMERDAILAHGVSLFLQESMMKRSDAASFWICNGCGTIPISNEKEGLFVCPMCDGPIEYSGTNADNLSLIKPLRRSRVTFSKVEMPYALKVLEQELTTFSTMGMRFITERSVGRLKDSMIEWKHTGAGTPPPTTQYVEANKDMVNQISQPLSQDDSAIKGISTIEYNEYAKALADEYLGSAAAPVQVGGEAPINHIDTVPIKHDLEEEWPSAQVGGEAPINHVDTVLIKHDLEEELPSPQIGGEVPLPLEAKVLSNKIPDTDMDTSQIKSVNMSVSSSVTSALTTQPVSENLVQDVTEVINKTQQIGGDLPMPLEAKILSPNENPNFVTDTSQIKSSEPIPLAPVETINPVSETLVKGVINVFENADIRVVKMI